MITVDDIADRAFTHAVIRTDGTSPHLGTLHKSEGAAAAAHRKLGMGGRIAIRHHKVVALDGPAPDGYVKLYGTMRDYLIDS